MTDDQMTGWDLAIVLGSVSTTMVMIMTILGLVIRMLLK